MYELKKGKRSARYIARACGCSTAKVYKLLEEIGYIKRYALNKWFITEKGSEHGEYSDSLFDAPIWDEKTQEWLFKNLAASGKLLTGKPEMIYEDYDVKEFGKKEG